VTSAHRPATKAGGIVADSPIYPQAPALSEEELREFLQSSDVARLATHNEDRSIHLAPVYYAYEAPNIVMGTQMRSRKARNVARDPRVTVLFDVTAPQVIGAIVYGTAELDQRDVVGKRAAIFRRYMPEDAADSFARSLADTWQPVIIRVRPERVVSFDYRKGFPVGRLSTVLSGSGNDG
jgi:PPOX class probable F420-dependent enzyme